MKMTPYSLTNKQMRHVWLNRQSLFSAPCAKKHSSDFANRVESLGMVQLDSIGVVSRAHHHILWSRQSAYRSSDYDKLLNHNRAVFEHFSHDAVILPMSTYPYWKRQHTRRAAQYKKAAWGKAMAGKYTQDHILNYIGEYGPVCSRDFTKHEVKRAKKSPHAWSRPAHKLVLDYLWLNGTLSVSHRNKFTKFYDLTERIIPEAYVNMEFSETKQINWLCETALNRLGVASALEIQRFWEACDLAEVQAWLLNPTIEIIPVEYRDANGNIVQAFAPASIEEWSPHLGKPSNRLRIVNPFDPVVRDRARLSRLFDFDYRIEIYTPPAKRKFGYYVFPLLEGDRFIGRIDVRANRETDTLETRCWWLEAGVKPSTTRIEKLTIELKRLTKLAGVTQTGKLPSLGNP
ncbi:MAG: hypothetical protein ACI9UN_000057 [Granulosicoccus sp.]|jgi:uncharacterized protein YcaQ